MGRRAGGAGGAREKKHLPFPLPKHFTSPTDTPRPTHTRHTTMAAEPPAVDRRHLEDALMALRVAHMAASRGGGVVPPGGYPGWEASTQELGQFVVEFRQGIHPVAEPLLGPLLAREGLAREGNVVEEPEEEDEEDNDEEEEDNDMEEGELEEAGPQH
jgi:hypothetical protein